MAVAVGILRHEQVVADEQRLLHRAGRNIERLEQERADDEGNDEGVKDYAPVSAIPPSFLFAPDVTLICLSSFWCRASRGAAESATPSIEI
jgi:hypothetical protein